MKNKPIVYLLSGIERSYLAGSSTWYNERALVWVPDGTFEGQEGNLFIFSAGFLSFDRYTSTPDINEAGLLPAVPLYKQPERVQDAVIGYLSRGDRFSALFAYRENFEWIDIQEEERLDDYTPACFQSYCSLKQWDIQYPIQPFAGYDNLPAVLCRMDALGDEDYLTRQANKVIEWQR